MYLRVTLAFLLFALFVISPTIPAKADTGTTLPAGFAPGSIWLSKLSPTAGDKITIYTVVYNSSPAGIEGSVSFYVDDTAMEAVPFTLDAGDTRVESVSWIASAGTHAIQARVASAIDKSSKAPASLSHLSTATTTITVAEKRVGDTLGSAPGAAAASTVSAITNAASNLGNTINNSNPIVSSVAGVVASQTEVLRQAGIKALSGEVATSSNAVHVQNASSTLSGPAALIGQVLGTTTYAAPAIELHEPFKRQGILAAVSSILLPIFLYPALFYPIFFFILVICLWFVAKRILRPDR